uniref:Uncharacterized protein n=1 Tax=Anguilla anguilla TaxID=7936 RepID=A0A0E9T927_ANGAN
MTRHLVKAFRVQYISSVFCRMFVHSYSQTSVCCERYRLPTFQGPEPFQTCDPIC